MLEDLPNFFKTLEYAFPQYFTGVVALHTSKFPCISGFPKQNIILQIRLIG